MSQEITTNINLIEKLKNEGYYDLGWANSSSEVDALVHSEHALTPIKVYQMDEDNAHIVYVDHNRQQLLHFDNLSSIN